MNWEWIIFGISIFILGWLIWSYYWYLQIRKLKQRINDLNQSTSSDTGDGRYRESTDNRSERKTSGDGSRYHDVSTRP